MALFDFLQPLLNKVKEFLGPLGKIWDKLGQTYEKLTNIVSDTQKLVSSIQDEISGWKTFKQDIRLKQRVINLETAIQKTTDLVQGIPDAYHAILDLVKQIKSKVGAATSPAEEVADIESGVEEGGIRSLLNKFPVLAKAAEKLLGFLGILVDCLDSIVNAIGDLQTIVDEAKRLRLEIEKLDTIFLQQNNKRKNLKLADGSSIRVRVGRLHAA